VKFSSDHGAWIKVYHCSSYRKPENNPVKEIGFKRFPTGVKNVYAAKNTYSAGDGEKRIEY
jgi:hypothetical protein